MFGWFKTRIKEDPEIKPLLESSEAASWEDLTGEQFAQLINPRLAAAEKKMEVLRNCKNGVLPK